MGTDAPSGVELVQAGLAALNAVDVVGLADAQVRAQVLALVEARNQLDAALADRVATFDARDLARADGQNVTSTWLVNFARLSKGAALALVTRGRLMRRLGALATKMRAGSVSAEQFAKVSDLVRDLDVDTVRPYDQLLADLAARTGPGEVGKACERILALENPDGAQPDPAADFARREIVFSRLGSMLYVRGRLDAHGAAVLQTAVDALMSPPSSFDGRTAPQRRADAVIDLAHAALTSASLPSVGGEAPHIGLLITPEILFGTPTDQPTTPPGTGADGDPRPGGADGDPLPGGEDGDPLRAAGVPAKPERAWLNWVGEVSTDTARRIACDATVWRLIVDPRTGLPLDVGSKHRFVPVWMKRALWARDRVCRFPGCDRPCEWTDAHHLIPWWRRKVTDISGLISLCRYHHVLVHEGGWGIRLDHTTGEVHATRPDGRPYELGPSQPFTTPTQQRPGRTHPPPIPTAA